MATQSGEMAVGLFDLLGFKALIEDHEHRLDELRHRVISAMASAIDEARRTRAYAGSGQLGSSLFSDTLFLWIPTTSDCGATDTVERMCVIASLLLSRFMEAGLPIRGAVAVGECTASIDQPGETGLPATILLGRPVVDAYELERAQEWSGAALCSSAAIHLEHPPKWPAHLHPIVHYPPPLKESFERRFGGSARLSVRYFPDGRTLDVANLIPKAKEGPSYPSAEKKRQETIRFYQYCVGATQS